MIRWIRWAAALGFGLGLAAGAASAQEEAVIQIADINYADLTVSYRPTTVWLGAGDTVTVTGLILGPVQETIRDPNLVLRWYTNMTDVAVDSITGKITAADSVVGGTNAEGYVWAHIKAPPDNTKLNTVVDSIEVRMTETASGPLAVVMDRTFLTFRPGDTTMLSGAIINRNTGVPVTDPPWAIRWRSSSADITVDSITGQAIMASSITGSRVIGRVYGEVVDTSAGGGAPPATPVVDEYFQSGSLSYKTDFWDWAVPSDKNNIIYNPSFAYEGDYYKEFEIPGANNPYWGHNNEQGYHLGYWDQHQGKTAEIWIEYWIKYPVDYWRVDQNTAIGGEGASDASISAGNDTLTATGASFDLFDKHKWIQIAGAGPAGDTLWAVIDTIISPTQLVLRDTVASTTVSNAWWNRKGTTWGNWKWFVIYGYSYESADRPRLVFQETPSKTDPGNFIVQYATIQNGTSNNDWINDHYFHIDSTQVAGAADQANKHNFLGTGEGVFVRGQWTRVRWYFNVGTDVYPSYNGQLKLWIGDRLVSDQSGIAFYPEDSWPNTAYPYWSQGYFFGSARDPSPIPFNIGFDALKIYHTDPGW